MSKIIATIIAGLFAVSAFATDAPKADTKAPTAATAPAANTTKAPKHKHHVKKAANKTPAAVATPAK